MHAQRSLRRSIRTHATLLSGIARHQIIAPLASRGADHLRGGSGHPAPSPADPNLAVAQDFPCTRADDLCATSSSLWRPSRIGSAHRRRTYHVSSATRPVGRAASSSLGPLWRLPTPSARELAPATLACLRKPSRSEASPRPICFNTHPVPSTRTPCPRFSRAPFTSHRLTCHRQRPWCHVAGRDRRALQRQ